MKTLGIIGGGQLGKFLGIAAANLGIIPRIFSDAADCPAAIFPTDVGAYTEENLRTLHTRDALTYEFEHLPLEAIASLPQEKLFPSLQALQITQNRLLEKDFLTKAGVPLAPYHAIISEENFTEAKTRFGDFILKTCLNGYDGKGQMKITNQTWDSLPEIFKTVPCVAEKIIAFDQELSLISVRSKTGEIAFYPLVVNHHENHILKTTELFGVNKDLQLQAEAIARTLLEQLTYVGVLTVEFFLENSTLLVNELAPRVHNSGHWTLDAARTSQFENHVRAIMGLPLGATDVTQSFRMTNLLGEDILKKEILLQNPNLKLYDYGKIDWKIGRKMGHTTEILS